MIKVISRRWAKPFVEKHHYTKSIGKVSLAFGLFNEDTLVKRGFFEEPKLTGVITYGQVSARDLAQSIFYGGNQYNCWEFLRMAVLDAEKYPRSKFISKTIKHIKRYHQEIKCLVSFADQTEGHFGYVYQASNWLYCGKTGKKYHYKHDGKRINKRVAFDRAKQMGLTEKQFVKEFGWQKITELPKFRYIYPLDKRIVLKLKVLDYPKAKIR